MGLFSWLKGKQSKNSKYSPQQLVERLLARETKWDQLDGFIEQLVAIGPPSIPLK